jgi:hypothetical protein|tara:strand:- start:11 stop:286 length:276 start_codon:yes stop_codon:yes gene_type:complete
MKQSFKLESIEKTGSGVESANIICTLAENRQFDKQRVYVKLRCTSIATRIMSDHLVCDMKHICEYLDTEKARQFAKDMLDANKKLKEVRTV